MPTTCVDVMPSGLSTITQPWTGAPFFLRPMAVVCLEVALHARGFQQRLDLLGLGEGLVLHEAKLRRELSAIMWPISPRRNALWRLRAATICFAFFPPSGSTNAVAWRMSP